MFLKWGTGVGDSISIITIGYYLFHDIFPGGRGKKNIQPPTLILMQTSAADTVAGLPSAQLCEKDGGGL